MKRLIMKGFILWNAVWAEFRFKRDLNTALRDPVGKTNRSITKIRLFKYMENLTAKYWKFSDKNSEIFHISGQNIDCGFSLEPPCRGGSNEYLKSIFLSRNKKNNV